MRRITLILFILCAFICTVFAAKEVRVKGYYRKDGTYVAPHVRTAPNSTRNDNYSTRGNVNPHTGKAGTKPRDGDASAKGAVSPQASSNSVRSRVAVDTASGKSASDIEKLGRPDRWKALHSGLTAADVKCLLGEPAKVEKTGLEVWKYADGDVILKDGKVMAWRIR